MADTSHADGTEAEELFTALVGDRAAEWDRTGELPLGLLHDLGSRGLLCAQAPAVHGGLGWTSRRNGELTAHVGALCSSLRSVMTSQGMAAWTLRRLAGADQQASLVPRLTGGELAAVAFTEAGAGSDLSALRTRITSDGDEVVVDGVKVWATNAAYADLLVVFGRTEQGAGAVVVPASAPGVRVERITDAHGCRAAGHADIHLDGVRLPADALLQGHDRTPALLVTTALSYGRMSVAWGSLGILRACLAAAARHAGGREQFGTRLSDHQLVARHLAELFVAEQHAARACEHASAQWDEGSPDMVVAAVLAKHVAATGAARGAERAVQVLASAGAREGHVVARAHRDAKLMEIIEGSNEICELVLARHVMSAAG
ncbi:putative dehydrogenase [Streptomyces ambofaciens ATCC 23877]|uniref:Putative dehydrogenase n=2 Tax=Streptomyces ambofaciens TaxID=1889 RepID=A0A0K2B0N2_STRA7|nr:acyl-CoA dehydrogenase family protein [Streptomyces ambofaciens]AKZ58647.1 putative dehydrogenase [Streptomyces ambofaciens ATCC 23877]CAM96602.1 putative dehydrogenase [Streptomyces ambofaciens ATCC 23877]